MVSIRQHPRNLLILTDREGRKTEIPGYTCRHCNRSKAPHVTSINPFAEPDKVSKLIAQWFRKQAICLKCDAYICAACKALEQLTVGHHPFEADMEKAYRDRMKQPWFLRDRDGDPVYRIFDKDGNVILAKQRECGYTQRELERLSGDLTLRGTRRTEQDG